MVTDRPSLTADGLDDLWARVRARLERQGVDNRGRVTLPDLGSPARLTLGSLLGRPPGRTVDLAVLERALVALGLGPDLAGALADLGHPVSPEPARRRAGRAAGRTAREAARTAAATWSEPWASAWIDEVIRAGGLRGLDATAAVGLVGAVRLVLDHLDAHRDERAATGLARSRVEVAAKLLGSAHDLDTGTRLETATTRALAHRLGAAAGRDLWEQAGAHLDLTSGPVLTWRLPVVASSPLAPLVSQATALGAPLHLTRFVLGRHRAEVEAGTVVLVVENPRVVEAAAQLGVSTPVVAANGNPSGAVRLLLAQFLDAGAALRYHGDFDVAGLAMAARMAVAGLEPWRMDAAHYRSALREADDAGVDLPRDPAGPGPTPWDPALQSVFDRERRIVHEERLLPGLLDP